MQVWVGLEIDIRTIVHSRVKKEDFRYVNDCCDDSDRPFEEPLTAFA